MNDKRAVVFSGGGAKGGYQIGVWKALNEVGFRPDIITGTSVGALNGALMALDKYKEALHIWENMGLDTVFTSFAESETDMPDEPTKIFTQVGKAVLSEGGADFTPLQNLVKGLMDEPKFRADAIDFGLVTTKMSTLSPIQLFIEDIPEGEIADYILASAACFPFMKSYKIGNRSFIDGGYSDNLPVKMAAERGAKEIIVINIGTFKKPEPLTEYDINVHYIHNKRPFNQGKSGSMLLFNQKTSLQNIQWGYLDGIKQFGLAEGNYYAFHKGESEKVLHLYPLIRTLYHRVFSALPTSNKVQQKAIQSIEELFAQEVDNPFTNNNATLTCAELTAENFDVNPYELYTYYRFEKQILSAFFEESEKFSSEEFRHLAEAIDKGISVKLVRTALDTFNTKTLAFYTTHILLNETIEASHKLRLWLIAALMPTSFCMGLFCATLLKSKDIKNPFVID